MRQYGGTVLQTSLSREQEDRLRAALAEGQAARRSGGLRLSRVDPPGLFPTSPGPRHGRRWGRPVGEWRAGSATVAGGHDHGRWRWRAARARAGRAAAAPPSAQGRRPRSRCASSRPTPTQPDRPRPPRPGRGLAEPALQVHFLTRAGPRLERRRRPGERDRADPAVGGGRLRPGGRGDRRAADAGPRAGAHARVAGPGPRRRRGGAALRLDQVGALHDVVDLARRRQLAAGDGLARWPSRRPRPVRRGGPSRRSRHPVGRAGADHHARTGRARHVRGPRRVVGLLAELGRRWWSLGVLLPVVAAALVSVVVFLATRAGYVVSPLLFSFRR